MHGPINVKSPNNNSEWQMEFNSAFKGLKDSFYEELERVFHHFPKYHIKILLGDFNAEVERNTIFKSAIRNDSLHQDSNKNGVRIINFATKNSSKEQYVPLQKRS
jgi:hypothetical protein